ncbi:MAG: hypothetical protein AAF497_18400, partial [Planctomycetota bacterium]
MSNILSIGFAAASKARADSFISQVEDEYPEISVERIELVDGDNPMPKGAVVILLFDDDFSVIDKHTHWLTELDNRRSTTPLLPVALGRHGKPPEPIGGLKARFAGGDEAEILRSIGAMLGLTLRPGKNKIFVSYRSEDGRLSAKKIFEHL